MKPPRPDKWFESALRRSAVLLAFLFWSTFGLLLWFFIASRVTIAFSWSLIRSASKHTDIKEANHRFSEGIHWWSDGFQRIRSSLTAEDFDYPQVSSFVLWQECLYMVLLLLTIATYHFIVPSSQAIYSTVYGWLNKPTVSAVIHNKPTGADQPPTSTIMTNEILDSSPDIAPAYAGDTISPSSPMETPEVKKPGEIVGALPNSPMPLRVDEGLQSSDKSQPVPDQPKAESRIVHAVDDPSTFTTGFFNRDGIEILKLHELPASSNDFEYFDRGVIYLKPGVWSHPVVFANEKEWTTGWGCHNQAINFPDQEFQHVFKMALDGDFQNSFTIAELDEASESSVLWKRLKRSKSIQFMNTGSKGLFMGIDARPKGWTP
jgi:hypothetical protein